MKKSSQRQALANIWDLRVDAKDALNFMQTLKISGESSAHSSPVMSKKQQTKMPPPFGENETSTGSAASSSCYSTYSSATSHHNHSDDEYSASSSPRSEHAKSVSDLDHLDEADFRESARAKRRNAVPCIWDFNAFFAL